MLRSNSVANDVDAEAGKNHKSMLRADDETGARLPCATGPHEGPKSTSIGARILRGRPLTEHSASSC